MQRGQAEEPRQISGVQVVEPVYIQFAAVQEREKIFAKPLRDVLSEAFSLLRIEGHVNQVRSAVLRVKSRSGTVRDGWIRAASAGG